MESSERYTSLLKAHLNDCVAAFELDELLKSKGNRENRG